MLRYLFLTILALHCNCQRVVDLRTTNLPLKTVNGFSTLGSYNPYSAFGSYAYSPLSTYGLGYGSRSAYGGGYGLGLGLGGIRGYGINAVNNLGIRSVNIAPTNYGLQTLLPFQQQQIAVQPAYQTLRAFQQPAVSQLAIARPAVAQLAIARPAVAQLAIAQPQVAFAAIRPQVYAHQQAVHPVSAAIHQIGRTVEYRPTPYQEQPITPQVVEVEPSDQPIHIHFKSRSSSVRLSQEHQAGEPGTIEQTSSQDEPSKVIHEVVKPVIQEVREVIQPYRQLTQEVQPVVENVHTVVSHGEGQRQQYVAEPQVYRPQVQQVRQVAVQQVQPAVQVEQVEAVAQPIQYQTVVQEAQPLQYQTVVREAQPIQYQTIQEVQEVQQVPQVQYQSIQVEQPIVSSYRTVAQPLSIRARYNQEPVSVAHSVQLAEPISTVNKVVSLEQPTFTVRKEARDVMYGTRMGRDQKDFRIFAESD